MHDVADQEDTDNKDHQHRDNKHSDRLQLCILEQTGIIDNHFIDDLEYGIPAFLRKKN